MFLDTYTEKLLQSMQSDLSLELFKQLEQLLSSNGTRIVQKDIKRQACEVARKLWMELEEPGDKIDRLVFQVCHIVPFKIHKKLIKSARGRCYSSCSARPMHLRNSCPARRRDDHRRGRERSEG